MYIYKLGFTLQPNPWDHQRHKSSGKTVPLNIHLALPASVGSPERQPRWGVGRSPWLREGSGRGAHHPPFTVLTM